MKIEFKPEDFGGLSREFWFPEMLAIANARLAEMIAEAPLVYCLKDHLGWICDRKPCSVDTHTARLVDIEEIKR